MSKTCLCKICGEGPLGAQVVRAVEDETVNTRAVSLIDRDQIDDDLPEDCWSTVGLELARSVPVAAQLEITKLAIKQRQSYLIPKIGVVRKQPLRKTLVLDLDETLVHASRFPLPLGALIIPVRVGQYTCELYVAERPYLRKFLTGVAKLYDLVAFTASSQSYADPVLDAIDPNKTIFSHRLFKDSCIIHENLRVKDLYRLGRSLRDVVLLDDSIVSATLQPHNLILIKSWYTYSADRMLLKALELLKELADSDDVRRILAHRWQV